MGGVGKTRLAVEYAWRHASDYKDALLFVSARSPVDLRANLAELCNPSVLNLPEWNQPEEIVRLAAVFRWLSEHSGWLLILDNADTPEAAAEVEKTLPQLQSGEVIITSRIADWSHRGSDRSNSTCSLKKMLPRSYWSAPSRDGRRCLQTVKMLLRLPVI